MKEEIKMNILINVLLKALSFLVPKKKKRIVFGSWFGDKYADNSKFMLEYISKEFRDFDLGWVSKNDISSVLPDNCRYLKYGTFKAFWFVLRSKIAFVSQGFIDLAKFPIIGNCFVVQLWHGVAWKKIGVDGLQKTKNPLRKIARYFVWWYSKGDLYIAPSVEYSNVLEKAFSAKKEKILLCGQPRNIVFFDNQIIEESRRHICSSLYVDKESIIITYMPTFRDKGVVMKDISFLFNNSLLSTVFNEKNVVVLVKGHFADVTKNNTKDERMCNRLIDANSCDSQELLCASDVLITDYSSCFFDFLLLKRPIITYIYDYEYYLNRDRGLYYKYDDIVVDRVAFTENELVESVYYCLNHGINEKKHNERLKRFCTFESPNNCKSIFERVCKEAKIRL